MSGITYDPSKRKVYYNRAEYNIYTGMSLDERVLNIIKFAEGDMTLQYLYLELLLYDKELMMK